MRLAFSFLSPLLFIPLIELFWSVFFRHLFSSFRGVNDPGGLAGCEQKLVNQDLRREGEDPRRHAGFQTACGHRARVCVSAGGCQHRSAWHRSRFQRLPRKWGRNNSANSVLKTDRESDFGELTAILTKNRLSRSLKKEGFIYIFLFFSLLWEFGGMT